MLWFKSFVLRGSRGGREFENVCFKVGLSFIVLLNPLFHNGFSFACSLINWGIPRFNESFQITLFWKHMYCCMFCKWCLAYRAEKLIKRTVRTDIKSPESYETNVIGEQRRNNKTKTFMKTMVWRKWILSKPSETKLSWFSLNRIRRHLRSETGLDQKKKHWNKGIA